MTSYFMFIRENARWLVGGFLLCFFSSFGQTFFIALSGGQIRAEYGLTNGEWGGLYMVATLASALTLPLIGRMVDTVSIAKTSLLIIPALSIACFSMSFSTSWILLGITIYLLRLFGQGMMTHTSMTAMGRWYQGHRGRAVSLAVLGHQTGEALLPITMVSAFIWFGWRNSWAGAGVVLLVFALPVIYALLRLERMPRSTDKQELNQTAKQWTREEVLRDPMYWLLSLGVLAPAFIGTTIFFHQAYLLEIRNWPAEAFASAFLVMAIMTITFALISGVLVDRFGAVRVLPFFFLPLALSCFSLVHISEAYGIFVFMGFLGISYGISSTLFGAIWPEIYGTLHLGAIRSVTVAMMVFASAMGPGVSGLLIDRGVSYISQIFVMGIYCLAASLVMLFVSRKLLSRSQIALKIRRSIMTVTVRFAPSPTGNIHIGNARTALVNWVYAKQNGGDFILRFDDTDQARSKQEYADGIARDLKWLGINPDRVEKQSGRFDAYGKATEKLKSDGLLYACYETPDELDRQRKRLAMRGKPPVYDRSGLNYSAEDLAKFESEGRKPHWRFLLPNFKDDPKEPARTEVHWNDLVRGEQTVDLASMSDPVLVREDGTWLYTLPSVVDDIEFGVTHIIRGDDHVTNTGAQIAVFKALGGTPPTFGHHNLLTTASGEGLSKRLGSLSLQSLAEDHYEPMSVASLATLIGTSGPVEAVVNMNSLIDKFDITSITKSAAKFDVAELDGLNAKLVHELSFEAVEARLAAASVGGGEAFWNAVKGNINKVEEAAFWWQKVENAEPLIEAEDKDFIAQAATLLPAEPWDETTWMAWVNAAKQASGRKGKGLFMPLRKALTGEAHGPELAALLPIIGRERTLARLS